MNIAESISPNIGTELVLIEGYGIYYADFKGCRLALKIRRADKKEHYIFLKLEVLENWINNRIIFDVKNLIGKGAIIQVTKYPTIKDELQFLELLK